MLLNACATVPTGTGGSGRLALPGPQPGSEEWEALEEARRAEVESALAGMWGVAAGVNEVGAELEFSFWAEGGALTLLWLRRREQGGEVGRPVDKAAFSRELRENLRTYVEGHTGSMRLTLRRQEGRWRADYETEEWSTSPLEAKTWPVRRVGVRAEVLTGLLAAGNEVASRLWVPAGGQARWKVEIALEDEWVRGLETQPPHSWKGGFSVRKAPDLAGTLVNVLLPFSQGLGPRKVKVELEGASAVGARGSRWRVVAAEVIRPPPPAPENADAVVAYRKMHEQIQRQWREETREGFHQMGLYSLEQIALWVIGGLAARGVGVVVEAVAPTIARGLAQGGTRAVGWFRSVLARTSTVEKQALNRLMVKAETQGVEALTIAERSELHALVERLEKLPSTPLNKLEGAKNSLRREAQARFYQQFHPELEAILRTDKGMLYDVHHRIPLEYAHRFPLTDINSEVNLVAAAKPVHERINKVWMRFGAAPRTPHENEILQVEEIVA
ncbi:MAG TPA: hypothetical protein VF815_24065, partial [Myxococcaceae bacterium]